MWFTHRCCNITSSFPATLDGWHFSAINHVISTSEKASVNRWRPISLISRKQRPQTETIEELKWDRMRQRDGKLFCFPSPLHIDLFSVLLPLPLRLLSLTDTWLCFITVVTVTFKAIIITRYKHNITQDKFHGSLSSPVTQNRTQMVNGFNHPITHITNVHTASGATQDSVSCPRILWHADRGNSGLVDEHLFLLSHCVCVCLSQTWSNLKERVEC